MPKILGDIMPKYIMIPPDKPIPPLQPVEPMKISNDRVYISLLSCERYDSNDCDINYILSKLPEGYTINDIRFEAHANNIDFESFEDISIYYNVEKINNSYYEEIKEYEKLLKKYQKEKLIYEEKLKQFKIDAEEYVKYLKELPKNNKNKFGCYEQTLEHWERILKELS